MAAAPLVEDEAAPLEVAHDVAVRFLAEAAGEVGHFGRELAVRPEELQEADPRGAAGLEVVLAERRGDVDDPRPFLGPDVVGGDDLVRAPVLRRGVAEERLVLLADQRAPREPLDDLHALGAADLLDQRRGDDHVLARAVPLDARPNVLEVGAHGEGAVARQRPGRRRPGEVGDAGARDAAEAGHDRRVVHRLVAEADLARGEGGPALRPPPDDLVAAVEQPLAVQFRQRPPDRLDVRLVEGDVGARQVDPEADPPRQFLPLLRVAEDRVDAAPRERLDPVGLDLRLAVDPEFLLDLDLDRQAVGVPARLARHVEPAHRLVAREEVLHHARQDVAVVRQPVGGRRTFVEDEAGAAAAALERTVENVGVPPEVEHVALDGGETVIAAGSLVRHGSLVGAAPNHAGAAGKSLFWHAATGRPTAGRRAARPPGYPVPAEAARAGRGRGR